VKTRVLAFLLAILMLASAALATEEPVSSVTIDELVRATGTVITSENKSVEKASGMLVYLDPIQTAEHQAVLDSIAEHVADEPVAEYFVPEVVETIIELLPIETNVEDLKMDEFLELKTVGYTPEHGDVQVAFEFATPYTEEDTLVGMVGIMASSTETVLRLLENSGIEIRGSFDKDGIFWLAVKAEVIDGKVVVHLPQGVLELTGEYETLFALFSTREIALIDLER